MFVRNLFALFLIFFISFDSRSELRPVDRYYKYSINRDSRFIEGNEVSDLNGVRIFSIVGDLREVISSRPFTPDGIVIPTNVDLDIKADFPVVQKIFVGQLKVYPKLYNELQDAIYRYRNANHFGSTNQTLDLAREAFVASFSKESVVASFPRVVCMVATDYREGGSINFRDFFTHYRISEGIHKCVQAMKNEGVKSIAMPLIGAASIGSSTSDLKNVKNRRVLECRLANSFAGVLLGVSQSIREGRGSLEEVGIIQYQKELERLFFSDPDDPRRKNEYKEFLELIYGGIQRRVLALGMPREDEFGDRKSCEEIFFGKKN